MTKHKLNKMLKVYIKTAQYKKNGLTQQIQPNYYLSVASVDSNTIESTCIFPETLNKCINTCAKNTSKTKITS